MSKYNSVMKLKLSSSLYYLALLLQPLEKFYSRTAAFQALPRDCVCRKAWPPQQGSPGLCLELSVFCNLMVISSDHFCFAWNSQFQNLWAALEWGGEPPSILSKKPKKKPPQPTNKTKQKLGSAKRYTAPSRSGHSSYWTQTQCVVQMPSDLLGATPLQI